MFLLSLFTLATAQDLVFKNTEIKAPFLEQFDAKSSQSWIPSTAKKEGSNEQENLAYNGEWNFVETGNLKNDLALTLSTKEKLAVLLC